MLRRVSGLSLAGAEPLGTASDDELSPTPPLPRSRSWPSATAASFPARPGRSRRTTAASPARWRRSPTTATRFEADNSVIRLSTNTTVNEASSAFLAIPVTLAGGASCTAGGTACCGGACTGGTCPGTCAATYSSPVSLAATTSLHAFFRFSMGPNVGGGDGVAFVLQNSAPGATRPGERRRQPGVRRHRQDRPRASSSSSSPTRAPAASPLANRVALLQISSSGVTTVTARPPRGSPWPTAASSARGSTTTARTRP